MTITRNKLQCVSSLQHKEDKWTKLHVKSLSDGLNYFDFVLSEGDLAVYAFGGHGYEMLKDDTQIVETKNGPFVSVDKDKEKF